MSQQWTRISVSARCALCGLTLRDGDPTLAVQIDNERYKLKRPLYYCVECKGPAPPDLAPPAPRDAPGSNRTKNRWASVFGEGEKMRADLARRLEKHAPTHKNRAAYEE